MAALKIAVVFVDEFVLLLVVLTIVRCVILILQVFTVKLFFFIRVVHRALLEMFTVLLGFARRSDKFLVLSFLGAPVLVQLFVLDYGHEEFSNRLP